MTAFSLYIHFPFCLLRCAYCDFFSTAGRQDLIPPYLRCVGREVRQVGAAGGRPELLSLYLGGGTPSLAMPQRIAKVVRAVRESFQLPSAAEITLEANPGTVDEHSLSGFREAGINRLSLGVQSADDSELRMLGRMHTFAGAASAVGNARRAGFSNLNIDLIFGLPGQLLSTWGQTLHRLLDLQPDHVSLYALTMEKGTPLARAVRRGSLPMPDDDLAADMYASAGEMLAAGGFRQYEISNWARDDPEGQPGIFPAHASRHNLQYWRNLPYLGLGAGAHGCAAGRRYSNRRSVDEYICRMENGGGRRFPLSAATSLSRIRTRDQEMRETMWLGLRLVEAGVSDEEYRKRFGVGLREAFPREIEKLESQGLLEWTAEKSRLRLVPSARFIANAVFREFV